VCVGGLERTFPALGEHGGVYVGDGDGGGRRGVDVGAVVEQAEGDVAGSTGYVEHFPACARGRWRGGAGVYGANKVVSGGGVLVFICLR
jgi:hypothetical protein